MELFERVPRVEDERLDSQDWRPRGPRDDSWRNISATGSLFCARPYDRYPVDKRSRPLLSNGLLCALVATTFHSKWISPPSIFNDQSVGKTESEPRGNTAGHLNSSLNSRRPLPTLQTNPSAHCTYQNLILGASHSLLRLSRGNQIGSIRHLSEA